ncbi:mitochondrial Sulfide:quinone oxidoreductase [Chytridium lagenaria]|nr:mitochondrial Sulfide:quinone oxidoreductase [Chytridium lagenaria]
MHPSSLFTGRSILRASTTTTTPAFPLFRRTLATTSNVKPSQILQGRDRRGWFRRSLCGRAACKVPEFAASSSNQLLVIDPADTHYYQPLWTFVGGGLKTLKDSGRPMSSLIPGKTDWLKTKVSKILPSKNLVLSETGEAVKYDYLVVAPGIQINWDKIPGLKEALGKDGVSSNYSADYVEKTAEYIRNFKGGKAIFTQPATPVKCAGAPQKIMYLAEEQFRASNIRSKTDISFHSGMGKIFSVDKYGSELTNICKERDIAVNLLSDLVAVDGQNRKATFKKTSTGETTTLDYDFMHVTPPMGPPSFLKECEDLTNADGWVSVDKVSTRHVKYANVFAVGDASSMPTSKTAAAAAAQSGVLVWNLVAAMEGREGGAEYNGYTSCPLVTGKGKLILAEFDYDLKPRETFFLDQGKQNSFFYYLTSDVIPSIYWNRMVKGNWIGPQPFRMFLNPFNSN